MQTSEALRHEVLEVKNLRCREFLNSRVTILRTMDHGLRFTMAWYIISIKSDIPQNPITKTIP
jgi:hypothetical protein